MCALDVSHVALGKPPREQALPPEIRRLRIVQSVEFFGCVRFLIYLECFGRLRLHAERKLQSLDTRFELRVVFPHLGMTPVNVLAHIQLKPLVVFLQALTQEIFDWLATNVVDLQSGMSNCRALISSGQESRAPVLSATMGECGLNGYEPG